ncbi:uncharacterized protein BDW47DRAFT_30028 [Aspergillus candidus]|uniref:Peptidyl-tRNA hydrolase n=1 Tax=Aspergillus candidus TaxID=41067 RepID=A0A2I2FC75_ASPCN|nr:hypothetical protein BDW47DRAFT_30028 [Aspergillus candidus]PLB38231.1 hypothetical protein BDW47DRAFT_30028 [Aspergillus candidus]
MRFIQLLPLLPALAAAQEQVPLGDRVQGWFNKAKSYLPTATPVIPAVEKLVDQKKIQQKTVTQFNLSNWQSLLEPSSEPQDWMVYITGGNKTCSGRCGEADKSFNQSLLLLSADPTSPNLGYLDCESNKVLCSMWAAGCPSVYYFKIPEARLGEDHPVVDLHTVWLNTTGLTSDTIYKIHSEKKYEEIPPYAGPFHPTNSWLAQNGLLVPAGYVLYAVGAVPSWLVMVGISFFSRTVMSRRVGGGARA